MSARPDPTPDALPGVPPPGDFPMGQVPPDAPGPSDTPRGPLLVATRDGGLKGRVDTVLGWAVAVLMGLSVLNVTWQVVSRFVLGSPSGFTDELARILLIWTGLLGAAYAAGQRMHLAIDLLPTAVATRSARGAAALALAGQVLVAAFAAVAMVWGGAALVQLTGVLGQRTAAMQIPLGAVYSVLPLAGALVAYYALHDAAGHVRTLRGSAPPASPPPTA